MADAGSPASIYTCPDCGASFYGSSTLVDHAMTVHVGAETPAAHLRRPGSPVVRRALAVLGILPGVALLVLVIVALAGGFDSEKPAVAEHPESVVHKIAVELELTGEIDEFRAVEPKEGWDVEYELGEDSILGYDAVIRIRNEGRASERMEWEAYSDQLYEAIEAIASERGFTFQE